MQDFPNIKNNVRFKSSENKPNRLACGYQPHVEELITDTGSSHISGVPLAYIHVNEYQILGLSKRLFYEQRKV